MDPVAILRPGDQGDGAAAEPVVERDHLRHLGHLDPLRRERSDQRADNQAADDDAPVSDALLGQGGGDGDRHTDGGQAVAPAGRGRVGAELDPVDEQGEGDDVEQADDGPGRIERCDRNHLVSPPSALSDSGFFFFLVPNISSMRSVTMKPPTMLTVPNTIAMKPITSSRVLLA